MKNVREKMEKQNFFFTNSEQIVVHEIINTAEPLRNTNKNQYRNPLGILFYKSGVGQSSVEIIFFIIRIFKKTELRVGKKKNTSIRLEGS